MRKLSTLAIAAASVVLLSTAAHAQGFGLQGFGGKLGYTTPEDLDGTFHVGAHLEFASPTSRFHILPNLMYWQSQDVSNVNPNLDAYYHFSSEGTVTPYLGAGLGVNFINDDRFNVSDTNVGANVFGGLRFPGAASHYFVEARYTASDISGFSLLGGITFRQ